MKANRWALAAFVAAMLGALIASFAPLGRSCSASFQPGEAVRETCRNVSIFSQEGAWVLIVVSVPVLVALLPVVVRPRPVLITSAVLLWTGSVVALASVGLFFVPAALLMTVAAAQRPTVPMASPRLGGSG